MIIWTIIFIMTCLCITIVPLILMLLWNWLAPLFWVDAPILTFWQTFGIYIFILILTNLFRNTKK